MNKIQFAQDFEELKNEFDENKKYFTPKEMRTFFGKYKRNLEKYKSLLHNGYFEELANLDVDLNYALKYKRQSLINKHLNFVIRGMESDLEAIMKIIEED